MAFAFTRVNRTGADDSEGFSTLDKAHHEQSTLARITDDHLAMFANGVIRIVFDTSNIILEDRLRLGKCHSVLAEIVALLVCIPIETRHRRHA